MQAAANDTDDCEVLVGIQVLYGYAQAYAQWNATFAEYLTEESGLGCVFTIVPLEGEAAVYNAVANATVDLIYSNPGMHVCLEVCLLLSSLCWPEHDQMLLSSLVYSVCILLDQLGDAGGIWGCCYGLLAKLAGKRLSRQHWFWCGDIGQQN